MAFGTILAAIPSRIWRRPTDPVSARLPDLGSRGAPGNGDGELAGPTVSVDEGSTGPDLDEPVEVG
jgi:hypothetical protein